MKNSQLQRWKTCKLREVIDSLENGSRPRGGVGTIESGIPSIGGEHITTSGSIDFSNKKFIPVDFFKRLNKGMVRKDDVLLVKDGATTGKVCLVKNDFPFSEAAVNEHVFIVRANRKKVLPPFLFYYLFSSNGQLQIKKNFHGAAIGGINTKFVDNFWIPIPSLKEQQRIVTLLEAAFNLKKLREQANQFANKLLQAVFIRMFGDTTQNTMGWCTKKLKDICKLMSGGTPTRTNESFFKGSIPWITTVALGEDYIESKNAGELITEKAIENSATKLIPKKSVLIGTRVGVGKVSINKCDICTNQDIISLTNIIPEIKPIFLVYHLRQNQNYFDEQKRGAIIQGIPCSTIKELLIPIPDISLQNKFANIVDITQSLCGYQKNSTGKITELFNALLSKAFKGGLV